MTKCLITKLPVTVENDNLPIFNSATFVVANDTIENASDLILNPIDGKSLNLALRGEGELLINGSNVGKKYTISKRDERISITNITPGTKVILYPITNLSEIGSSYDQVKTNFELEDEDVEKMSYAPLTKVQLYYSRPHNRSFNFTFKYPEKLLNIKLKETYTAPMDGLNLENLKGAVNLNYLLGIGAHVIKGDISSLSGLTNLQTLIFQDNKDITGNISSLSGLTKLTHMQFHNCINITGTEDQIKVFTDRGCKVIFS